MQTSWIVLSAIPDAEKLWLIGTGTGIAPFLSMLRTEAPWRRFQQVILVHSVRHAEELTYGDAVAAIAKDRPAQFRFVSLTNREEAAGSLPGRVVDTIADGRLEKTVGLTLDPKGSQVMICGSPKAIGDITDALKPRGMRRHRRRDPGHIIVENYW